ncbi:MAG: translation initiation factor [Deltaproteobacteria bacterium]|nr:translation initiation factor [Deltaproteobacteria bacterium]
MADENDNPFARLASLRDALPEGKAAPPAAPEPPAAAAAKAPARAVVRFQRKGFGGKTVTLVEKLDLPDDALATWLKDAKTALGLGGRVVDGDLVLQGDCRDRLADWLRARGVKKVTVA